tara:strand:+ start:381 stop:668 length:288 start_codon:yes stop_codon:yes gene_type:complete
MSTNFDFDFALTNYTRAMCNYTKAITLAKEEVLYCRRRRIFDTGVDHFYHWHLNHVAEFRNTALNWLSIAEDYRKRLTEIHENAYYGNVIPIAAA